MGFDFLKFLFSKTECGLIWFSFLHQKLNGLICFSFQFKKTNPVCFDLVLKQIRFVSWGISLVIKHHYMRLPSKLICHINDSAI